MATPRLVRSLTLSSVILATVIFPMGAACGSSGPDDGDGQEQEEKDPGEGEDEVEDDPSFPPPGVTDHGGPGAPEGADENSDHDGYCYDPEAGYFECDDGVPPGTGIPGFEEPGDGDGDGPGGDGDGPGGDGDGPGGDGDGDGPGGDGDGDGPGGDGDGDGPGGGGICTEESFSNSAEEAPRILLVVDKSGSMDDDAVGFNGSKWDGAVDALSSVVESTEDDIEYGLMLYPDGNSNNNVCREGAVEVNVGLNNANDVTGELSGTEPGGGTPTAATLQEARDELNSLGDEGGTRAVVLATDGGPNCNESLDLGSCFCMIDTGCDDPRNCLDDTNAISAAQALNDDGYAVFVIGLTGSEDYTGVLEDLATAGGTGAYYEANDSSALSEALADIVVRLATCRFDLEHIPIVAGMEVSVGGNPVPQDPTRTNGWDVVDADTIELFGTSCNLALAGGVTVGVDYCYGANDN